MKHWIALVIGGLHPAGLLSWLTWTTVALGEPWPTAEPAAMGLDPAGLNSFSDFVGGRGCVVRYGRLVHAWGDIQRPSDVASACKPVFTHFLLLALQEGRIGSLDEPISPRRPALGNLNVALGHKDRGITWRHLANQTSCYGLAERPGTAFAYNDWQMALFIDLLFNQVHGVTWPEVDAACLGPKLMDRLGCEDQPTLLAFGPDDRPGRLSISPRDFARFGQLYLQRGQWHGTALLREDLARMAVSSPLPAQLPRAGTTAAEMLPGQRTLGSRQIPDNQTDHFGGYSWLWWVQGMDRQGRPHWLDAPADTFAALGHGGMRGVAVFPSLELVVSWNDSGIQSPARENEAFRRLVATVVPPPTQVQATSPRLRLLIETDAGGDPDDEQSLVRFLLYANAWDLEGIIANRPTARADENRNPERTGLAVVQRLLAAYATCHSNLAQHDPRFPAAEALRARTVAGYNDTDAAVDLILAGVDRPDPRPLWYSDWGTDHGAATNNLRRALDRVRRERGPEGYARFKATLRLASYDAFGEHTTDIDPPFPLWVDTFRPELQGRRWYHQFSALTARAGGFDLVRDCLTGHGPLGALYPTNTTHGQKEGDTMTFLYLVPTGMNDPEHPDWGSWAGRYGPRADQAGRSYYWANQEDAWQGTTNRDHTLARWAVDLQNDFRARLDWCAQPWARANHPPRATLSVGRDQPGLPPVVLRLVVDGICETHVEPGDDLRLNALGSSDPDGDALTFEWLPYPEAGSYDGALELTPDGGQCRLRVPQVDRPAMIHLLLRVQDQGVPPLARYHRLVLHVARKSGAYAPPNLATGTRLAIADRRWLLNGQVTYPRAPAEGRLLNVRLVNAVFEDTRRPGFDTESNTDEFLAALPDYFAHGVRAFTIGLQGGMPGYEGAVNSAFEADGSLRAPYLARVRRVIEACDRAGAAVLLSCFYQRQDQILRDESAVRNAVAHVARWIVSTGHRNVALEIANEFGHGGFDHPLLRSAAGQVALIRWARRHAPGLLVSSSGLGDGRLDPEVAAASDFLLIHFNGTAVSDISARIADLRRFGKPIVCNEDDKVGEEGARALRAAVGAGASWGFMHEAQNQRFPFEFRGANDDLPVYRAMRQLADVK